jgi:hypothetical protein
MKNEDSRGLKRLREILFPSSNTSYIEEGTSTGEEYRQNNTENTLKCPGAP